MGALGPNQHGGSTEYPGEKPDDGSHISRGITMKFSFEVMWSVGGSVDIEAESLEEARKKATSLNPCAVGNAIYVEDSWCVEESEED